MMIIRGERISLALSSISIKESTIEVGTFNVVMIACEVISR
jgi:hypothetical protein